LAKRLTNEQKEDIIQSFIQGETVSRLSKIFKCTYLTVTRNLKKSLGEKKFKEISAKNNLENKSKVIKREVSRNLKKNLLSQEACLDQPLINTSSNENCFEDEIISSEQFIEIVPLEHEIDNLPQKDLASIPIADVELPNVVYMVVEKTIELHTKYLKEYPEWNFLSQEELNRKTIAIYSDLKVAKRSCNKEQKVIKVPNSNVFKLVVPQLLKKGITRIISFDKLISL
tara:strand:+ start:129 stop:812 length:684 start_codon:yes stop_codon:yes gene_type:complete